ncbi:DUF4293 domain-containing protein [Aquimarina sp. MMG016]|uniref:DUF4293 domain-containing protein n=1 Tax=Aquimarina sp. MMG016 TaxID=2822690 RepID=UPI001B3A5790|nr:DUF4293 domain-containing protein [Aquimarina sp. MMG016]MBQ4820652.1 DUF4293 domain-containing protein [Aquimarina sp. MMG016]
MLQRIQTVYLLLTAGIAGVLWIYLPYGTGVDKEALYMITKPFLMGMFIGSAILALISIFLFKNRKLQFVLGRINIILNFILLGVFVYWSPTVSGETYVSEKGIGMIIPIISIVLLVMANRAIKKDENLVKSVDRLR